MTMVSEIALPDDDKEKLARAQLRSAIERRDLVRGELAEADKAASLARSRLRETEEEVEALERKRTRPDMALASASALVEAVMDGREMAVGAEAAGERERRLRAEAEALRTARDRIVKELAPSLRGRLEMAEVKCEELARATIAASSAPERLLVGLLEMQASVLRRRVGLAFVRGCLSRGAATTARAPVFDDRLEDSAVFRQSPVAISERAKWAAALKALETDPDAKLPGDEGITE
jgi:hypothetical protein